jgi:hypothetical protein
VNARAPVPRAEANPSLAARPSEDVRQDSAGDQPSRSAADDHQLPKSEA